MAALNRFTVLTRVIPRNIYPTISTRWYSSDEGAIREAGGSFSKREKAVEDQYFRRLEKEQMEKLKQHAHEHHKEEIEHHENVIEELQDQIKRHKEKIERHKKKMEDH